MNARNAGLTLAVVQLLLVSGVALKYAADRARLPAGWARTVPFDPSLPFRGRYVRLRLQVPLSEPAPAVEATTRIRLVAAAGRIYAVVDSTAVLEAALDTARGIRVVRLSDPIAFFIPEHVPDPSARARDEELWAEVTLVERGAPRPIRLGIRRGGALVPLDLR
ncbi:MAG TPA: hypothetical protein VJQ44_11775 [Gemmatimonadales bacterium]|nr:hypothetical protein [Gemmatimonadales bacterium]